MFNKKSEFIYYFEGDDLDVVESVEKNTVYRDIYNNCDYISADCEAVASAVFENGSIKKKYLPKYQIFILNRIEINDKHKKHGIGSTIIRYLPKMMQNVFKIETIIFLYASDYKASAQFGFDSVEYKTGTKKLIDFYKKLRYKVVKDRVMIWMEGNEYEKW